MLTRHYAFGESEIKKILLISKNKIKSSVEFCSYGTSSQGQINSPNQIHNKGTITRGGGDTIDFNVTLHKNELLRI